MKTKEAIGISILVLVGLLAAFIAMFILLVILPTHPGNEQHRAIMNLLIPGVDADLSFLTEKEFSHMQDVKFLTNMLLVVFIIGVFTLKKIDFGMRERYAGYGLLGLVALVGGLGAGGFDALWMKFHVVFFPQGNWMFPYDSILITLYPESYFLGAALVFAGFVLLVAAALIQGVWYKQVFQKPARHKKL